MPALRFAVQSGQADSPRAWRERARQIEDLGYSTLYLPDHLGDQWGPVVAMTVAAEATRTLRVGSLVFDNDYRHPVVLAKEMATLDLCSEGRVEVGLGAGWKRSDYEEAGLAYDQPGERVDRLAESLAIMKALWAQGSATMEGSHYRVRGAQGLPRPFLASGPTLVVGGGGRRLLSLAAAEADVVGVNPSLATGRVGPEVATSALPERYRERLGWIRQAAGDRFCDLELQCLTFVAHVGPGGRERIESMAPLFGLTADAAAEVPVVLAGTVDQVCDTILARREEYGLSYWVVHDAEMEAFAPVVARLAGR